MAEFDPLADCEHGSMMMSCPLCRPSGPVYERKEKPPSGAVFQAQFFGTCRNGCGKQIEPGETIVRLSGDVGYIHLECP